MNVDAPGHQRIRPDVNVQTFDVLFIVQFNYTSAECAEVALTALCTWIIPTPVGLPISLANAFFIQPLAIILQNHCSRGQSILTRVNNLGRLLNGYAKMMLPSVASGRKKPRIGKWVGYWFTAKFCKSIFERITDNSLPMNPSNKHIHSSFSLSLSLCRIIVREVDRYSLLSRI